jgi:hypothetical protein
MRVLHHQARNTFDQGDWLQPQLEMFVTITSLHLRGSCHDRPAAPLAANVWPRRIARRGADRLTINQSLIRPDGNTSLTQYYIVDAPKIVHAVPSAVAYLNALRIASKLMVVSGRKHCGPVLAEPTRVGSPVNVNGDELRLGSRRTSAHQDRQALCASGND